MGHGDGLYISSNGRTRPSRPTRRARAPGRHRGPEADGGNRLRRNLFGPVDHQQLQQDFQRLLRMSAEAANKRWNFDFQSDAPGEGADVEWEELRCQDVPAFYRSCTVRPAGADRSRGGRRRRARGERGARRASVRPCPAARPGSGDEYLEVTTRGCYRLQLSGKRRQAAITDFFTVKKRNPLHYKATFWQ
ncbi:cyclin-dependent kinase inhibitor 1D [Embiotoca jacksoni]|uniref:cyclin-dependent kinase inhibitor 1D n=1 Tax=Embiotoca jacksoni TaxID=100190 RepID=UPI003703F0FC